MPALSDKFSTVTICFPRDLRPIYSQTSSSRPRVNILTRGRDREGIQFAYYPPVILGMSKWGYLSAYSHRKWLHSDVYSTPTLLRGRVMALSNTLAGRNSMARTQSA